MRISVTLLALVVGCGSVPDSEPDGAAGRDAVHVDGSVAEPDGPVGDGPSVDASGPADARGPVRACAIQQAEHPGYTTIARDVALCGNRYDATNIATACAAGWHVCRVGEWTARYPARSYKNGPSDTDTIGPTIGPLTSWGDPQDRRCVGNVWEADQPLSSMVWTGDVCHVADDAGENTIGADYNPWNNGKFLYGDDGLTIMQGLDANGTANWGSWDRSFAATTQVDGFAVYCCAD